MSDLDGILEAITLEHLNAPGGPQRITVTAEGSKEYQIAYEKYLAALQIFQHLIKYERNESLK